MHQAKRCKKDWEDGKMYCFGMLIDGRAQTSGIKRWASDVTLLIVINGYYDLVKFTLPEFVGCDQWLTFIDTNDPERSEASTLKTGDKYEVTGRSLFSCCADQRRAPQGDMAPRARSIARGRVGNFCLTSSDGLLVGYKVVCQFECHPLPRKRFYLCLPKTLSGMTLG
jgi:hypothetical protein